MAYEAEDNIRVSIRGSGEITLKGFSQESEKKTEEALTVGTSWIRVKKGKLEAAPAYHELPDPAVDNEMLPFWRRGSDQTFIPESLFDKLPDLEKVSEHSSASLTIQSLCGYCYTPELYRECAAKLVSYGFECLRSRRGADGRFWEIWYLPSLYFAEGDLQEHIKGSENERKKLELALMFLACRVPFGTLDASAQRLAMPPPD